MYLLHIFAESSRFTFHILFSQGETIVHSVSREMVCLSKNKISNWLRLQRFVNGERRASSFNLCKWLLAIQSPRVLFLFEWVEDWKLTRITYARTAKISARGRKRRSEMKRRKEKRPWRCRKRERETGKTLAGGLWVRDPHPLTRRHERCIFSSPLFLSLSLQCVTNLDETFDHVTWLKSN